MARFCLIILAALMVSTSVTAQSYNKEKTEYPKDGFIYVLKYNNNIKAAYSLKGERLTPDSKAIFYEQGHFRCYVYYHPERGKGRDELGAYSQVLYDKRGKCILADSNYTNISVYPKGGYIWCQKMDGSTASYNMDGSYYAHGYVKKQKNTVAPNNNKTQSNRNSGGKTPSSSNNAKVGNNSEDQYYFINTGSGYLEMWIHPDGSSDSKRVMSCYACRGSSNCNICYGTGNGYVMIGRYMMCPACGGSGSCRTCKGEGMVTTNTHLAPGEAEAYLQMKREERNSKSTKSSTPSRTQCSKCMGSGYESVTHKYAAASAHGWSQPYHNKAGEKCPYCGAIFDHYHYPCTECFGWGRVSR